MIAENETTRGDLKSINLTYSRIIKDIDNKIAELRKDKEACERVVQMTADLLEGNVDKYATADDNIRFARLMSAFQASSLSEYSGLTVIDAAKNYLNEVGKFSSTKEILTALANGGYPFKSKTPYHTVFKSLSRAVNEKRGIIKKGSKWGLAEWDKRKPRK